MKTPGTLGSDEVLLTVLFQSVNGSGEMLVAMVTQKVWTLFLPFQIPQIHKHRPLTLFPIS